jgi:prephenate dehydrogenase
MKPEQALRVHIVGTGLIGTSVGLALQRVGWPVTLEDASSDNLMLAVDRGAGVLVQATDPAPDIIVVATPPGDTARTLANASVQWPNATLTDVASVKAQPLTQAVLSGCDPDRLVGGHPMAGREISGPVGARADLFDDRVWVVCPTPETSTDRVDTLEHMVRVCGGIAIRMTPERHDEAVALTSHAPQVLSSVLAARLVGANEDAVGVAGQGLRDMTRIAESDPTLWQAILTLNSVPVSDVLRDVISDLTRMVAALDSPEVSDDRVVITDALMRGVQGRSRIPGKHGNDQRDYVVISVLVRDEPGELARLFVAAGALGINLEDVRIEHVLGRPSGLIDLSVKAEVAVALQVGLSEQGFDVRS